MDTIGTIVSWVQDAWNASSRLPSDPGFWGILFAILVLAYLLTARSLRRLDRRLSSTMTELEEIRSALKGIERTLQQARTKTPPADREGRSIQDLPLREGKERPQSGGRG